MSLASHRYVPRRGLRSRIRSAACSIMAGTACSVPTQAAPVPLENFLDSTWQVLMPENRFGTAFLVSNEGYFITAAHVVLKSTNATGPTYHEIKLQPDADPAKSPVPATVVKNWCDELEPEYRICRKGSDAVLLKTAAVDKKYLPFDMGFTAVAPKIFPGVFAGYASRQVGAALSNEAFFKVVDVATHNEYKAYFSSAPVYYYQTLEASFQGNSGGPIAFKSTRGYEVVGILSWRKPGSSSADRAGPTFGATIDVMRNIWSNVPRSGTVKQLADDMQTGAITAPALRAALNELPNTSVVSLISELQTRESQNAPAFGVTEPYWIALYDSATVRELDLEKRYLEPKIDIAQNISWLRDSAKTQRRLGEYAALSGDDTGAKRYFTGAVATNERFLKAARASQRDWFGPAVFNDVVAEMGVLHASLGDKPRVADWAALGVQTGSTNATAMLAKQAFSQKDFKTSADLYALAYQQAQKSGRTAPTYVIDGYEKSVSAASRLTFPNSIEAAPMQSPKSVELDRLSPGWKQLAKEYGPAFANQ